ncbi:hypothetical protein D3C73_957560 [compost metagenome]
MGPVVRPAGPLADAAADLAGGGVDPDRPGGGGPGADRRLSGIGPAPTGQHPERHHRRGRGRRDHHARGRGLRRRDSGRPNPAPAVRQILDGGRAHAAGRPADPGAFGLPGAGGAGVWRGPAQPPARRLRPDHQLQRRRRPQGRAPAHRRQHEAIARTRPARGLLRRYRPLGRRRRHAPVRHRHLDRHAVAGGGAGHGGLHPGAGGAAPALRPEGRDRRRSSGPFAPGRRRLSGRDPAPGRTGQPPAGA